MIGLATRGSALALAQTELVIAALRAGFPEQQFQAVVVNSEGDLSPDLEPPDLPGQGWFTSSLERALLRGEVDGAVHSAKDLPTDSPAQLRVGAYLPRADPRDALVATAGIGWQDLPRGGRVGTSSPRRSAQLRALRPDLEVVPMRGNVETRLGRVAEGTLDACLLAQAGLDRLGLQVESSRLDPVWECTPAPAQGAVAVQVRAGGTLEEMVTAIDDPTTRACVEAERLLLRLMGGGCRLALGVLAQPVGPELVRMAVAWAAQSPTEVRRVNRLAPLAGLEALAHTLAGELR